MGTIDVGIAESAEEKEAVYRFRYDVYVDELGRYRATADHVGRRLVDSEDDRSCIVYAHDGREVVGSFRLTWGGSGFSARQLDQYQLRPFLSELPDEWLLVGERTMIAPRWRGTDLFERMGEVSASFVEGHDVRVVFGACEPHLISFYVRHQRPYGSHNINSPEAGYLIPLVSFPKGVDGLATLRDDGRLPDVVCDVLSCTGTVTSPELIGRDRYLTEALASLAAIDAPVVRDLEVDEVAACLHRSNMVRIRAGDVLLRAGGSARNAFILLEGDLTVSCDGRRIGSVRPGETVGEMAHLLARSRGADVRATTDGRVISLSDRTLSELVQTAPSAAAKLHRNIARLISARLQDAGSA